MRNFLAGILVAATLFILGGLAYLRLGFAEVRADIAPGKWERATKNSGLPLLTSNTSNRFLPTSSNSWPSLSRQSRERDD